MGVHTVTNHRLDLNDVLRLLRRDVERAGGQAEWARRTGVDRTHLNQVMRGRKLPAGRIVRALGLKKLLLPTVPDVLNRLTKEVERAGSQSEWARRTGVDRTYLNKVMSARKNPGPDLIRALKLKQVAAYAAQGSEQAPAEIIRTVDRYLQPPTNPPAAAHPAQDLAPASCLNDERFAEA
jgi:DNA-binding phage protein